MGKAILAFAASVVQPFAGSNRIVNALITDNRLRTVVTALPGMGLNLIYAVAAYTFCKLTISIINMVNVRKENSLLLTTLRDTSYSDALVSLLSLQTALFAAFGQDAGKLVPTMNFTTGGAVCLMILGLGICMVYRAKKLQSKVQAE